MIDLQLNLCTPITLIDVTELLQIHCFRYISIPHLQISLLSLHFLDTLAAVLVERDFAITHFVKRSVAVRTDLQYQMQTVKNAHHPVMFSLSFYPISLHLRPLKEKTQTSARLNCCHYWWEEDQ